MSSNEACSTILTMINYDFQYSQQIDSVAHGLMRYRLIDILANVLGCEKYTRRKSFGAVHQIGLPAPIQKIRKSLCDWPKTVTEFGRIMGQGVSSGFYALNTVLVPLLSSILPMSSPERIVFQTGISNLVYAARHSHDVKYHKVMVNVQLVVFALCWFGMVCCRLCLHYCTQVVCQGEVEFPQDEQSFLESILRFSILNFFRFSVIFLTYNSTVGPGAWASH